MKRTKIKDLSNLKEGDETMICGWVKTIRTQKDFAFIEVNDGSSFSNFQVIIDKSTKDYDQLVEIIHTGSSVQINGILVKSPGHKQSLEMRGKSVTVFDSNANEDYPLQKKRHSFEFLRTIAHLRPRTNTQGAVARLRNALAFATHEFFQLEGFLYLQSPIITASDCEGAGELFQLTTLDMEKPPKTSDGKIDYSQDFFGKAAYLTVSGQLNAEAFALALSDVYTFGPTFRAENSNTSRHLAEFWMIEPEMAFADLKDNMAMAEKYLKYVTKKALERCSEDLQFFDRFIEKGLLQRLDNVLSNSFAQISYTKAIEILEKSNKKFEFPHHWGVDLQSEHERYIAQEYAKCPVIIYDYPKTLKPFYMRENDDQKTVAAMDILVPKVGEIVGGSQREERYDIILQKAKEHQLDLEQYDWYLQLRKYGTVNHSGFGVGFERLVQFVSGIENIRDINAFPRTPNHCDY